MSTKIYNGIKFLYDGFQSLLNALRIEKKLYEDKVYKILATLLVDEIKDNLSKDTMEYSCAIKYNGQTYYYPTRKIMEIAHNIEKESACLYFEYIIFPHNSGIYGMWFCGPRYGPLLKLEHIKYEDFYYFDNADKPKDITDEEWEERYNIWNDILFQYDGIPSNNGFSYVLYNKDLFNIVKFIDALESTDFVDKTTRQ